MIRHTLSLEEAINWLGHVAVKLPMWQNEETGYSVSTAHTLNQLIFVAIYFCVFVFMDIFMVIRFCGLLYFTRSAQCRLCVHGYVDSDVFSWIFLCSEIHENKSLVKINWFTVSHTSKISGKTFGTGHIIFLSTGCNHVTNMFIIQNYGQRLQHCHNNFKFDLFFKLGPYWGCTLNSGRCPVPKIMAI